MNTTGLLAYFCASCIVLFFRRLCSTPKPMTNYNFSGEFWWIQTVILMAAWPVFAPLCGAYTLGAKIRERLCDG